MTTVMVDFGPTALPIAAPCQVLVQSSVTSVTSKPAKVATIMALPAIDTTHQGRRGIKLYVIRASLACMIRCNRSCKVSQHLIMKSRCRMALAPGNVVLPKWMAD